MESEHASFIERKWLRLVVDHNPCYMLSGLFMLAGCYMISSVTHEHPDPLAELIALLGVFNLYEFLVIALACWVLRLGLVRDAGTLLIMEVLLIADVTMLLNEAWTSRIPLGAAVNGAGLTLAIIKMRIIARYSGLRLPRHAWVLGTINLTALLGVPGLLAWLKSHDLLTAGWLYGAWWLTASLIAITVTAARGIGATRSDERHRRVAGVLYVCLLALPVASLIGHLMAAHYAYDLRYHLAHLGPLMWTLGAIWIARSPRCAPRPRQVILNGACALAIAFSWHVPETLTTMAGDPGFWPISSLRVTLLMTTALFVYGAWTSGTAIPAGTAILVFGLAVCGHTPDSIRRSLATTWDRCLTLGRWFLPDTIAGWGVSCIVTAFCLLGAGAMISRISATRSRERETSEPDVGSGS